MNKPISRVAEDADADVEIIVQEMVGVQSQELKDGA